MTDVVLSQDFSQSLTGLQLSPLKGAAKYLATPGK